METYLEIRPAFPQRNQRVDRNVLKYSASSSKFPVTQRFIIHDSIHDQVTGANRVPLEEQCGGEGLWGGGGVGECALAESADFSNNAAVSFFAKNNFSF